MNPRNRDGDPTEDLLRRALADEAADVHPDQNALSAIQERAASHPSASHPSTSHPSASHPSASHPSDSSDRARRFSTGASRTNLGGRRPWMLGALGAAAATVAVIAAVTVVSNNSGNPGGTPAAGPGQPTSSRGTSTEPTGAPAARMHVGVYNPNAAAADQMTLYYLTATNPLDPVATTARLYPERHTVAQGTRSPSLAAIHEFLTSTPIDPDYTSGWPQGPNVVDVAAISRTGSLTTIALTGPAGLADRPSAFTYRGSELPVQAMLATAGIHGPTEFTYNGKRLDKIFGTQTPVTPAPMSETRAWVSITSPVEGQTVSSPVTVTGSANVFEANVNWQLLDDSGQVVDSGYTMAGSMEWKDFSIRLGTLAPGTYTIRAYEASPKNGKPTYVDDKTFNVR